jgi:hypothetical protein
VADLSQLAMDVNGGYAYTNRYFQQTANIDLTSAGAWQTIGTGQGTTSGGTPFAGYYSGSDGTNFWTISNIYLVSPKTNTGVGLFGNVTGQVANVTLTSGTIAFNDSANYVGAIVGYSSGSIINCQSAVSVVAQNSTNVGGIVGAIENQSGTALPYQVLVQYCKSTGNVTGQSRVGGIAGAVYCATEGNVAIDNSENTGGIITGTRNQQNVYAGGVVGYCQGYVSNSYAYNISLTSSNGGNYFGGVAGLLQGTNPTASLYNSYDYVSTWTGTNPNYDHSLVSRVDDSTTLPLHSDIWVDTGSYDQPQTGAAGSWGAWTGGTKTVGNSPTALFNDISVLNTNIATPSTYIPAYDATAASSNHPLLLWETSATGRHYVGVPDLPYQVVWTPGGGQVLPGGDVSTQIFFDPNGSAGSGTQADPTNNLSQAMSLVTSTRNVIYFLNTVNVTGNLDIDPPVNNTIFKRSGLYAGYLFDVAGQLSLQNIIIDGDSDIYQSIVSSSLIHVSGTGRLDINTAVTLQKNNGANGGAIRIDGGTANMKDGVITNNRADTNGGAVAVYANGTFNLGAGSVTNNTAGQNGGGIATFTGGNALIYGGVVMTGNTAPTGIGGAVFSGSGGIVTIQAGVSIYGNSAVSGGGAAVMGTGSGASAATLLMSGGTIGGTSLSNGNTSTSYGGGVDVDLYSTFTMTGGTITYNTSGANGGGVAILGATLSNPSTFTMSGTSTISYNTATTMGGGVFINDDGVYNLNGGSITNNTASGTAAGSPNYGGGGVYIGGLSPVFNMTAGTISGNTAVSGRGNGVYDYYTFNITPASGATFSIVDTIYLTSGTYINVGATVSGITGKLFIQMANTASGQIVAQVASPYTAFTNQDLGKFEYFDGSEDFTRNTANTQIIID